MRKQEFKGKLLEVSTRRVRLPNGFLARLEIVKHAGAALIVPFISRDRLIMLRQYRPVINLYLYELPAGTLDQGESPLACARREIIEETGFSAAKFSCLGEIFPVPGYSTEKIVIFKAQDLRKQKVTPEQDEVIQVKIFCRSQVQDLFKRKRIKDAKTICALTMAGWL